jgi:hypothetical protein
MNADGHSMLGFCSLAVVAMAVILIQGLYWLVCYLCSSCLWLVVMVCSCVCFVVPCIFPAVTFVCTPAIRAAQLDVTWLAGWAAAAWLFGQPLLAAAVLGCALSSAVGVRLVPWLIEQVL